MGRVRLCIPCGGTSYPSWATVACLYSQVATSWYSVQSWFRLQLGEEEIREVTKINAYELDPSLSSVGVLGDGYLQDSESLSRTALGVAILRSTNETLPVCLHAHDQYLHFPS